MELATNAILAAVLLDLSSSVENLGLPLNTPLEQSKVLQFRVGPIWGWPDPHLSCYLVYTGGFEFWHEYGCLRGFSTADAYTRMQNPDEIPRLFGEVRYSEKECLGKARNAIRSLQFTNAAVLHRAPKVTPPENVSGKTLPRFIFEWLSDEYPDISTVRCEVNAARLTIENLELMGEEFRRKPWPLTYGQTNVFERQDPLKPVRTEMEVRDVSPDYAVAFIRAILPETGAFCARLGLPIPNPITEADVDFPQSEVAIKQKRVTASLRLKNGYLVVFHAGHVWAVHAEDAYYTSPGRNEKVRQSAEYRGAITLTKQDATERIHRLLVDRLGLSAKTLYLDTEPVFTLTPNTRVTEGVRRFVFHWQRPEAEKDRAEREAKRIIPEISVSVEVDAVSGDIKAINFFHKSFQRPDPTIDIPTSTEVSTERK